MQPTRADPVLLVSPRLTVLLAFTLSPSMACQGPDQADIDWLSGYDIQQTVSGSNLARLGWQPPDPSCPQIYRIDVSYDTNPMQEPDSTSTLVLGQSPHQPIARHLVGAPLPAHKTISARLHYRGHAVGRDGATREVHFGRELLGPAAPTAACLPRTWDPMEDALALGWPQLSGRLTAVGESWRGARVEGKCNKTACMDPVTYEAGSKSHHRPCVTDSWNERMVGIYDVGDDALAAIESSWTDGHGDLGIRTRREMLFSVGHGRPVWAKVVIDHPYPTPTDQRTFAPIVRTWTMTAIDDCPGSLAAAGWPRPASIEAAAKDALSAFEQLDLRNRRGKTRRARAPKSHPESE